MKHETRKTRKYRISNHKTHQPMVVVEASSEDEALARSQLVARLIGLSGPSLEVPWEVDEHGSEPCTVPFYTDAFFAMMEAAASPKH